MRTKIAAAVILTMLGAGVAAAKGKTPKESMMVTPAEMKWTPIPDTPLQMATLWGDRGKCAYGMLLKLPAGFEAGLHSHTRDYRALNMQGTWVHVDEKGQSRELPPMSYVTQLGRKDHNDICKGPEECVLFIEQDGAGDFIPAKK